MTLANDSFLRTPDGSGTSLATHLVGGKEHPAGVIVDQLGHIIGSKPQYYFSLASQVHVAAANTIHWDLFNADASLIVRVTSILQLPNITTAVTGVVFDWSLIRTTAVGTGGTAQTVVLPDLSQTALDADITCRSKPTGGATSGVTFRNYSISSEETNAAAQMWHAMSAGGLLDLVPKELRAPASGFPGIVLRPSQGLKCVQVTSSAAGNTGWLIGFTVES